MIEQVAFSAREDNRIDQRSGVSQRLPISVLETSVSNAESRALIHGEDSIILRPSDIYAALPAITGKLELEYEGELVGADRIARELIVDAAREVLVWWGEGGAGGGTRPDSRVLRGGWSPPTGGGFFDESLSRWIRVGRWSPRGSARGSQTRHRLWGGDRGRITRLGSGVRPGGIGRRASHQSDRRLSV